VRHGHINCYFAVGCRLGFGQTSKGGDKGSRLDRMPRCVLSDVDEKHVKGSARERQQCCEVDLYSSHSCLLVLLP
jgi:hypothetical protein